MTCSQWDTDLAVTYGPLEEELDGQPTIDRYGITTREELAGEPLAVALAQEEPDNVLDRAYDDPWIFVEQGWGADDRLFSPSDDLAPEETAMHVVSL